MSTVSGKILQNVSRRSSIIRQEGEHGGGDGDGNGHEGGFEGSDDGGGDEGDNDGGYDGNDNDNDNNEGGYQQEDGNNDYGHDGREFGAGIKSEGWDRAQRGYEREIYNRAERELDPGCGDDISDREPESRDSNPSPTTDPPEKDRPDRGRGDRSDKPANNPSGEVARLTNKLIKDYYGGDFNRFQREFNNVIKCGSANCNGFDNKKGFLERLTEMTIEGVIDYIKDEIFKELVKVIFGKVGRDVIKFSETMGASIALGVIEPTEMGNDDNDLLELKEQLHHFEFYNEHQQQLDQYHETYHSNLPDLVIDYRFNNLP